MTWRHGAALALLRGGFALSGLSLGCGSGSTPPTTADADFYSCAEEVRAVPYQPGMSVTSQAGSFVVKVLDSTWTDPAGRVLSEPPAKGTNVWTIEVDDATTAAPVDGLTITVTPRMPDHRHGTKTVAVTPAGAGQYTVNPLYLYMVGYWEITLGISRAPDADAGIVSAPSETAMFPVCISG